MKYTLLTGATGLVGGYLIRDLLEKDVPVAVISRGNRVESAAGRIEAVMQRWERLAGRSLPRPVVLEGDLRQPMLALSKESLDWIAENADRILHNAASMTFREDDHGEPFRTNVEGMQNVLAVCRDTGIRKFHHVSTAYVCGLREGRVYEHELDVGQQNGNVYEVSKLRAEKLIRGADFIDELTVYRPASVVGDSATGFTTSTHGFYLPLQLAYVMADKIPAHLMGDRFFRLLGLAGHEGKNLVPVDWLAGAIVHLVTHPEHHGKTYHLTNPQPVTVQLIQEVVQEAIEQFSTRRFVGTLSEEQIVAYEDLFKQYMEIYRSHWRDDPVFDRSTTDAAVGHLPCPVIDRDMLLRIAGYPVKQNFALKRSEPVAAGFDSVAQLQRVAPNGAHVNGHGAGAKVVGLQVNGRGGGQWRLLVLNGKLIGFDQGLGPDEQPRIYLNSQTFASLVEKRSSVEQSLGAGRVVIEGGGNGATHDCIRILEHVVSS